MPNIDSINALSPGDAYTALLRCCGSTLWANAMLAKFPFASTVELMEAADKIWFGLDRVDWLEAFAAHPRIGDVETLRKKFATTAAWCEGEQAGVSEASDGVLKKLSAGNEEYEERFGYIFIVCATGKTAAEMLELLESRLSNHADTELRVAAGEQAKIIKLRLEKL
jgi:2-oxo-4-hydroxy-4-carboxy-5-ureidoimidazoline decarboxylase